MIEKSKLADSGNPQRRERLGAIYLLIKVGCFVKKKAMFAISKATDLN
jgi:hypothetical protein